MRCRCGCAESASWFAHFRRVGCVWVVLALALSSQLAADDFNIGSLAGLQWWASAQNSQLAANPDGTGGVGNGDPVGFISDLSGNGRNAVMGNEVVANGDSYRPLLQSNLVGGHSGILFNGSTSFSTLQSSLFDGAASATIAFAIEGANGGVYNQYLFGSTTGALGFAGYGNPYAGVQLANGQAITLPATQGPSVNSTTGSDTTLIMIARFRPGSESDLWVNGQLVATNVSPSSVGQLIRSPNAKILGNINYGSRDSSVVAPQSTATRYYFLEGLAATSAVSDQQVSQIYNYLSQQWQGIQILGGSPNLYWNTVTTTDEGHIQGVAIGDGKRFVFHTGMVAEYDSSWHLLTYNPAIGAGVLAAGAGVHSGDGDYAAGKVFAPLESDLAGVNSTIAVYDATKPGLPLITSKNISTPQHEFSSLVVVPTQGVHGIMFASSFEANIGGDKLWMYDYADGNVLSPTFGSFLGTLQIPAAVQGIQGVAWKAPYFYFSDGSDSTIRRVLYQNGVLSTQAELVWNAPTTVQGLAFDGSNLFQVLQSGSTSESAVSLTTLKFATPVATGTGTWNSVGDAPYSSPAGFDGVIPNGPASIAVFGSGTINTVNAPAVHVTIDAAYTLGSLIFNPASTTSYTLVNDNVVGHGLIFDNSGNGSSTIVAAGNHTIAANVMLADSAGHMFNVAPTSTLTVTGAITESGGSRSLSLSGGGLLVLGAANSYSGGTTIAGGLLQTTTNGALGSGPLTLAPPTTGQSMLFVGGNETIGGLSAVGSPSAITIGVASGARLNVRQTTDAIVPGTLVTAGTFVKSGGGTLELGAAPVMLLGSSLQIAETGKLRLNVASGSASVANGVVVQVADAATLELAGPVSALGGANVPSAAVVNNSTASAGLLVTGTGQQIGPVDGTGTTEVRSGSDLTTTHIIQNALVIGGTSDQPALVTIAASDSTGGQLAPLAQATGHQFSRPLSPLGHVSAFNAQLADATSLSPASKLILAKLLAADSPGVLGSADLAGWNMFSGHLVQVPEPPAALLFAVVFMPLILLRRRLARRAFVG